MNAIGRRPFADAEVGTADWNRAAEIDTYKQSGTLFARGSGS
jgi:hypothetical protein